MKGAERPPRVVLLNNSRETFTPTASGAIATCLWEVLRVDSAGGVEREVFTRGAAEAHYPHPAVTVLPTDTAAVLRGRAERAARRVTGWAHPGQRAYAHAALQRLRRDPPDAVICNNDPEIALFLSRRLRSTRVVHWFHNLEVATDRVRRAFVRDPRLRSVAVSAYLARAVEQVYRATPLSVAVALNGVDTERFRPRPGPDTGPPTVAFFGRVAVEKGTDTFLEAMNLLADRGSTFAVLVIGDTNWGFSDGGPYGRRVESLLRDIEERGVQVTRTGHLGRADVPGALRGAHIQVHASRWDEPCGLVLLEGMATGLAIVATATGGVPEVVGDAAVLVPRESPVAMADAVERLLDPERRVALGAAARRRAEAFGWERTWGRLEDAALGPGTVGT